MYQSVNYLNLYLNIGTNLKMDEQRVICSEITFSEI